MSLSPSPGIDESKVLEAFTSAYNDKFGKLMAGPAPSSCSACSSPPVAVMEVAEVAEAPRGGGGWAFWTVLCVLALLALLFVFGAQLCRPRRPRVAGASLPLSVEASLGGAKPASAPSVRDISDPAKALPDHDAVVMYHATWCGHCKQMRPLYERAAAASGAQQLAFYACEHSVLEKSGKSQQLGIQGYPTLIAFKGGRRVGELVGAVSADKLKAFLAQQ